MSDVQPPTGFQRAAQGIAHWLGITSTLVATATAIFTTQRAVSVNESNARDQFFDKQLAACTDLGDASVPLVSAINDMDTGYFLGSMGQKDAGKAAVEKAEGDVAKAYANYQTIMTRMFVLYPDSFVPLQGKIVQFTPTTLATRANQASDPNAAFRQLRAGFIDADIKLRQGCTSYLRKYAKANLMNRD